jgi:hypothetical protein
MSPRGPQPESESRTATVPVGIYALEFGSPEGTFALFEPTHEETNARALAEALGAADEGPHKSTEDSEKTSEPGGFVADASTVTSRAERCLRLFTEVVEGRGDPKAASDEIDATLALLTRLDRSGRHREALRLARDLSALLALLLRWLELARSLRLALRDAQALGDRAGEAWAHHELGSLHLAAGETAEAEDHLAEALRIKEEIGGEGRCVTRHNLDAARRDAEDLEANSRSHRRKMLRIVSAGAVLALLAGGGVALGISFDNTNPPQVSSLPSSSAVTGDPQHDTTRQASTTGSGSTPQPDTTSTGTTTTTSSTSATTTPSTPVVTTPSTPPTTTPSTPVVTAPPTITVPADIHQPYDRDAPSATVVAYNASASDKVDGQLEPSCSPASGSSFPLGDTTVKCSVTDSAGKQASGTFTVTIVDDLAPALTLPKDISESVANNVATKQVTFPATATDGIDGPVPVDCSPPSGSDFPVNGKPTTVSCTATDAAGNPASGSFQVTVTFTSVK